MFNFGVYPAIRLANNGKDLPEETFGLSANDFYGFLQNIGTSGRYNFVVFEYLDLINAVLLALAVFFALNSFLKSIQASDFVSSVKVFPVVMGVLDVFENFGYIFLTLRYPHKFDSVVSTVLFATNAKLVFGMFAFLSFVSCAIVLVLRYFFRAANSGSE